MVEFHDRLPDYPPTIPHCPTPLLADVVEYQYVESRGSYKLDTELGLAQPQLVVVIVIVNELGLRASLLSSGSS